LDAAVASYEKHLQESPADAEAKAGLATVSLMRRTQGADLAAAREAAAQRPDDLDAQLLVADLDMLGGHVDDAFARLLEQLRGADQETKDAVRARLLGLFEVAGPGDPRVAPARRRLANLLFCASGPGTHRARATLPRARARGHAPEPRVRHVVSRCVPCMEHSGSQHRGHGPRATGHGPRRGLTPRGAEQGPGPRRPAAARTAAPSARGRAGAAAPHAPGPGSRHRSRRTRARPN